MPTIQLKDLTYQYSKTNETIFKAATVTFPAAQLSLITGPSGCGKSTLLEIIAGFDENSKLQKQLYFDDKVATSIAAPDKTKLVSMMFQDPNQQFVMQTVAEELTFALENIQTKAENIAQRVQTALAFCEIEKLRDRQILTLSGGEKQKVILATMVALDSDIFLLDEPFASIDLKSKHEILTKLVQLKQEQGKTIIISDHDLSGYQAIVDEIFQINPEQKKIVQLSKKEKVAVLTPANNEQLHFGIPTTEPLFNFSDFQLLAQQQPLLNLDNFTIHSGCTLLTGESGIGKSTLFQSLAKLKNYVGSARLDETEIKKIKAQKLYDHLALVFQNANDQFLEVTVAEELKIAEQTALTNHWNANKIQTALTQLGLANKQDQVVYTLSGGQKKKLQILLMLIRDPEILLLDEPFAGLDLNSVKTIQHLLQTEFGARNRALIVISHQIFQFDHFFDYHLQFANQSLNYREVI
ncbi:ABC transporter ATP-binding protein [Fructilactobacillus vespulae]|uniref:ATP-binding cassette domain-containing protein n=1 Tax=Fructilactobacillus vespulae TaxID=1249630 RepID=UPI0039B37EE0